MADKRGIAIYIKPKEQFGDKVEYSDIIIKFDTSTEMIEKAKSINEDIAKGVSSTGINLCMNEKYPERKTHKGWRIMPLDKFESMSEIDQKVTTAKYKYIGILPEKGKITFNSLTEFEKEFDIFIENIKRVIHIVKEKDYERLRKTKYRFAELKDYLQMGNKMEKVFFTPSDLDTIQHLADRYNINTQTIYDTLRGFGLDNDRYKKK